MRALFSFLWRYYPFFLFVVLEVVAMRMVLAGAYQSSVSSALYQNVGGRYYTMVDEVQQYFALQEDNQRLAAENARLKNTLADYKAATQPSQFVSADSLYLYADSTLPPLSDSMQHFEYTTAKIINNQIQRTRNYLMIDKGSADGVEKNMGVVSEQGLVGIVADVSEHFSTALSLLNTDAHFSVLVMPSGELCSLHWDAEQQQYAYLLHLEPSADIAVGDTVISSGYSHIFPRGIMAGTVYNIEHTQSHFEVQIRLSVDFSRLHWVNIIRNPYYHEISDLEERSMTP